MTNNSQHTSVNQVDDAEAERLRLAVGKRLMQVRKALGKSRTDWVKQYGFMASTLSHWECGKHAPNMSTLMKICVDNDLSLDFILLGRKPRIRVPAVSVPLADPKRHRPRQRTNQPD